MTVRIANTLILATMHFPRLVLLLRPRLAQLSPILRSTLLPSVVQHVFDIAMVFHSIPHASGGGNGHGAGHQSLSISPTNSTSPVNRESSLSHFEKPPNGDDDVQATTTSDTGTNTIIEAVVTETENTV